MSEHREWHYELVKFTPFAALEKEHNAAVRAYRDAMAECERLGKANDEACDRISELEGASEKDWAEWNFERGSGPTPPTVKDSLTVGEDSSAVQSFSAAEYAALAADCDAYEKQIADLERRLAEYEHASGAGHPQPCTLGPLCPYCRIAALEAELVEAVKRVRRLARGWVAEGTP